MRVSPTTEFKKGNHYSPQTEFNRDRTSGENHPRWKGGITPESLRERHKIEYSEWRTEVFERDKYTCQSCFLRGGYLHVHHIESFAEHPELRFVISNGVTYCSECHWKLHRRKIGGDAIAS
jgi:hypothetical protein